MYHTRCNPKTTYQPLIISTHQVLNRSYSCHHTSLDQSGCRRRLSEAVLEPDRYQEIVSAPWVEGWGVCGLPASQRYHQTPLYWYLGSWKPSRTPQSLCCVLWSILSSLYCGPLLSCLEKAAKNVSSKLLFQQGLVLLWPMFCVTPLPTSGHYGMSCH